LYTTIVYIISIERDNNITKDDKMTKETIRTEAEKTAKESNCTLIEILSAMQSISAKSGDDKMLDVLCEIKSDIVNEM